uniref:PLASMODESMATA CALLOSE-BINDING PROTEIN 5-like n=1 Tax=Cicer arietinum TaxID=3827 RepID=A0A1S2YHC5_CICAR|nr:PLASMODESMATA CALLOSE-BINDING PROTEIN 5-like [Cicer arietinum]
MISLAFCFPGLVKNIVVSADERTWCVAKPGASNIDLQHAIDYACGEGGADCVPINPGGSCFTPDTLQNHASYAFNSYYQMHPIPDSCVFGGASILTNINPSKNTLKYLVKMCYKGIR